FLATSIQMAAAVAAITTARTASVGRTFHTRKPYRIVRLTQMKWNGTVSQLGSSSIASRLTSEKKTQAMSIRRSRFGHSSRSIRIDAVPNPTHGRDRFGAELGAKPPDVHVDDVRPGIEVVAPDRGQQALLRDRAPAVLD